MFADERPTFSKIATLGFRELRKEFCYFFSKDRPKKIIFDHLPKCGGISVSRYLKSNYPHRKTLNIYRTRKNRSHGTDKYPTKNEIESYDLIIGHQDIDLLNYLPADSILITLLRDPLSRIISHYYYAKKMEGHYLNKTIKDNDLSLGDYVESGLSKELNNWYVIHFSGASEDQVRENPEQYLKLALDNLKNHYDVIGFLDNIDHFIARTKNLANLKIPFTNQKLNVTGVSKERSQISEQSLEVVTKKNSLDIRFFKEAEKISQSRS